MSESFRVISTSSNSAVGQDISLRESEKTRLIFRPEIVNNPSDPNASVRGTFIFQAKKNSGKWEDYKTFDLSKLKDQEWVKLEIKSAELQKLITELDRYYQIHKQYGISRGVTDFIVTPQNAKAIILNFLQNPENFARLQELKIEDLKKLTVASSINSLKNILITWEANNNNADENYWQNYFKENSWVIAQVFAYPVILFKDKAYVGGKTIENAQGNFVDYIYKSQFTDNILLVEIKTPSTRLLGAEYRDGAYGPSADMGGAISQLLKYKNNVQQNYQSLVSGSEKNYFAFDPKCMLIVGNSAQLDDENKKRSFSLSRNNSRQVEVVTFDELFEKVKTLISLLEQ